MCGISGIFKFGKESLSQTRLQAMTEIIKHRGPDDEGYVLFNTNNNSYKTCFGSDTIPEKKEVGIKIDNEFDADLGMGFRRLAIIDISPSGHQPMTDTENLIWITFNGEIYNHIELRLELKKLGHIFHTKSDTEVIIQSYLAWGINCVERFIGMFAFALYDRLQNNLICARDRFGIKPFSYRVTKSEFIWASEHKQIAKTSAECVKPNLNSVSKFLLSGRQNTNEETFFDNILNLPPGHTLVIDKNRNLTIKQYWKLDFSNSNIFNTTNSAKHFRDLILDSIQIHLRSDTQYGIALSGGLDSSTIACCSKYFTKDVIKTFSVYYEQDSRYDERDYMNEIIKLGGFAPTFFTAKTAPDLERIFKWQYYQDAPCASLSSFSAYNNYSCVNAAKIKVLLNGQGADEVLGGYFYFFKHHFVDLLKRNPIAFCKDFFTYWSFSNSSIKERLALFIQIIARLGYNEQYFKKNEIKKTSTLILYEENLIKSFAEDYYAEPYKSSLKNALFNSFSTTVLPNLLHWEDRNSMAWSIESRVPFLNHQIVEFLFHSDNNSFICNATTKAILREAMKGIVPKKILDRKDKIGFATPTNEWTIEVLLPFFKQTGRIENLLGRNLYKKRELEELLKTPKSFKNFELWRILSLEIWFEQFINS